MSEHLGYDKLEKTNAQIAAQVQKISGKLAVRALKNGSATRTEADDFTSEGISGTNILRTKRVNGGPSERSKKVVNSVFVEDKESAGVTLAKEAYESRPGYRSEQIGATDSRVSIEAQGDHVAGGYKSVTVGEGNQAYDKKAEFRLSNDQIVDASASILSDLRGGVALREVNNREVSKLVKL